MTQTVLLGDVVGISSSKRIYYSEYVDIGVPFYRSKEIIEKAAGNNISTDLKISRERFNEIKNKFGAPKPGDLLLTSVGTLGVPYIVQNKEEFYFKDGNLTWFTNFSGQLNNKYLYYWLKSSDGKSELENHTIGSTQKAFTIQGLKKVKIPLPPVDNQKKIVDILQNLDEKIELNRQMNGTLEQMGQALFRHYFVDNVESEIVKVDDLLLFERGVEPGSKSYSEVFFENSSPFLRVGDLSQRKNNIFVDNNLLKNKFVNPNEVLVSFDGAPGIVAIGLEGSYSTGIRKVVLKDNKLSTGYAYFLMKSDDIQDTIDRYSEGTTIKHAPRAIENMTAKIPNNKDGMIELQNTLDAIVSNLLQIKTLTTLRDTLLPRLISGKIKV